MPSIRDASGSGTQRLYSFRDLVVLKVVKRLLDAGVSLQNIRKAIETLRSRGVDDLAGITLISDGTTVYECRSPEEVVDLLQGGQGVFGIAIGGAFKEIQGSLSHLPAEPHRRPSRRATPTRTHRRLGLRRAAATSWPPAAPAAAPADPPREGGILRVHAATAVACPFRVDDRHRPSLALRCPRCALPRRDASRRGLTDAVPRTRPAPGRRRWERMRHPRAATTHRPGRPASRAQPAGAPSTADRRHLGRRPAGHRPFAGPDLRLGPAPPPPRAGWRRRHPHAQPRLRTGGSAGRVRPGRPGSHADGCARRCRRRSSVGGRRDVPGRARALARWRPLGCRQRAGPRRRPRPPGTAAGRHRGAHRPRVGARPARGGVAPARGARTRASPAGGPALAADGGAAPLRTLGGRPGGVRGPAPDARRPARHRTGPAGARPAARDPRRRSRDRLAGPVGPGSRARVRHRGCCPRRSRSSPGVPRSPRSYATS